MMKDMNNNDYREDCNTKSLNNLGDGKEARELNAQKNESPRPWAGRDTKAEFRRSYCKMFGKNALLTLFGGLGFAVMLMGVWAIIISGYLLTNWIVKSSAAEFMKTLQHDPMYEMGFYLPYKFERMFWEQFNPLIIWGSLAILFLVMCFVVKWVMVPYWQSKARRVRDMGGNAHERVIMPLKIQTIYGVLMGIATMVFMGNGHNLSLMLMPPLLYAVGIYLIMQLFVFSPYRKDTESLPVKEKRTRMPLIAIGLLLCAFLDVFGGGLVVVVVGICITCETVVFIRCLVCKSKDSKPAVTEIETAKSDFA